MLGLGLAPPAGRPLSIVVVGAHPDDIEIGAGGTLLELAASRPCVRYVLLTGSPARQREARSAAGAFLEGADVTVDLFDLPEGRLPAAWGEAKEILETIARAQQPDLVIAPWTGDAHQDHRTIGEIVPTVFRDQLCLSYEIPKWDGDMGRPGLYFPLTETVARRKIELLHECYPSQKTRDWWDDEVFLGLLRLRGMECRTRYAEAFHTAKVTVTLPQSG
jgi:LmbE family N-acetylglucosaminyl deacetylase